MSVSSGRGYSRQLENDDPNLDSKDVIELTVLHATGFAIQKQVIPV